MVDAKRVALEVCKSYARRLNAKTTGRKILDDLSEKIASALPDLHAREIKVALLRLHVFNAPVPSSSIALRLSGLSKEEKQNLWIRSMHTPFNIEGVRFVKGFKEEIENINTQMIMCDIDNTSKPFRRNHR